jgi:hypothetical protein
VRVELPRVDAVGVDREGEVYRPRLLNKIHADRRSANALRQQVAP